jgi:hypothetical protein
LLGIFNIQNASFSVKWDKYSSEGIGKELKIDYHCSEYEGLVSLPARFWREFDIQTQQRKTTAERISELKTEAIGLGNEPAHSVAECLRRIRLVSNPQNQLNTHAYLIFVVCAGSL